MSAIDTLTPVGGLVHGALASTCSISAWHPLFTIKTWMMSGKGIPPLHNIYRGYGANLSCDISNQGVNFFSFRIFSHIIMEGKPLSPVENFIGGLFAGTTSAPLLSMLERVMIIQQIYNEKSPKSITMPQTMRMILEREGTRGLGKGVVATIMRESTNASCYFGLTRVTHPFIREKIKDENVAHIASYLLSGVVAGFLTTPFDAIKTRIQADTDGKYTSTLQAAKRIWKEEKGTIGRIFARSASARMGTIGATMATLGQLEKLIPPHLPETLHIEDKPE